MRKREVIAYLLRWLRSARSAEQQPSSLASYRVSPSGLRIAFLSVAPATRWSGLPRRSAN